MKLLTPFLTRNGWFYCFTGNVDGIGENILAYPLYYPNPYGDRLFNDIKYSKFSRIAQIKQAVNQPYSPCLLIDPWTVKIPVVDIVEIYDPSHAFNKFLLDNRYQQDVRWHFIHQLWTSLNLVPSNLGILGSHAVGCPKPSSDIDLVIYGDSDVVKVMNYLYQKVLTGEVTLMEPEIARSYAIRYSELYSSYDLVHLERLFSSDFTKIYVGGQKVSIIFCHEYESSLINIQDKVTEENYSFIGRMISSEMSLLYPRSYIIRDLNTDKLVKAISYQWLFKNLAGSGATVQCCGDMMANNVLLLNSGIHFIKQI